MMIRRKKWDFVVTSKVVEIITTILKLIDPSKGRKININKISITASFNNSCYTDIKVDRQLFLPLQEKKIIRSPHTKTKTLL